MEELSEKSKSAAGLLAIIPILGHFGVHRYYLGYTTLGVLHTGLSILGFIFCITVIGAIVGIPLMIGIYIWSIIEGVMIFNGTIKDAGGKALK